MSDQRLIDPTPKELVAALRKAMEAANRPLPTGNKMDRDAAFWGRFARDPLHTPEGRRRSCRGGTSIPEVIAAWWTDPAGRKHVRVVGRTRVTYARLRGEIELRGLPPWWHVYPESLLGVRDRDGGESFLAVCRCGAVGTPGTLGWMGGTCGPCFDRIAEGGVTAGGFGHFPGWATTASRVAFTADSRHLVGQNIAGNLRTVDRADGTAITTGRFLQGIAAIGTTTGGELVVGFMDGTAARWVPGQGEAARVLPRAQLYGRVALAPDGSRAIVFSSAVAYIADLTTESPRHQRRNLSLTVAAARFSPDGSRVIAVDWAGQLFAINPRTLAVTMLRPAPRTGVNYWPPADIALSPDGNLAVLHRWSYHPSTEPIRISPLGPGSDVEVPMPVWHQPRGVAFTPDGQYLVTVDPTTGWVGFWPLRLPTVRAATFLRAVPEGRADTTSIGTQIEFSPDGESVLVLYTTGNVGYETSAVVWPWRQVVRAAAGSG